MANDPFSSFVDAYNNSFKVQEQAGRNQYLDFADAMKLKNTLSNDAITRNYNQLIADRYGALTPDALALSGQSVANGQFGVNKAQRLDDLGIIQHPADMERYRQVALATTDSGPAIYSAAKSTFDGNAINAGANTFRATALDAFVRANPNALLVGGMSQLNQFGTQQEQFVYNNGTPQEVAKLLGVDVSMLAKENGVWKVNGETAIVPSIRQQIAGVRAYQTALQNPAIGSQAPGQVSIPATGVSMTGRESPAFYDQNGAYVAAGPQPNFYGQPAGVPAGQPMTAQQAEQAVNPYAQPANIAAIQNGGGSPEIAAIEHQLQNAKTPKEVQELRAQKYLAEVSAQAQFEQGPSLGLAENQMRLGKLRVAQNAVRETQNSIQQLKATPIEGLYPAERMDLAKRIVQLEDTLRQQLNQLKQVTGK